MFEVVELPAARAASGVRIVVVSALPSPWSEGAKALFHLAEVPMRWVHFKRDDAELAAWTRAHNAPVVFYDDEPPRASWADQLALAARLGGELVIPRGERVRTFGLASEVIGEDGLAWSSRYLMIDASLRSDGARGFPLPVTQYLVPKYGRAEGGAAGARARVAGVLEHFARELERSGPFLCGDRASAADAYLATTMTLLCADLATEAPSTLPPLVAAIAAMREDLALEIPPSLVEHRKRVFAHLPQPIPL